MLFSPTSAKSAKVKMLYGIIYVLLTLGGITMVAPFLIMVTGSLEPKADATDSMFFPAYLVSDKVLWERYIETKYHGVADLLRMAWDWPDGSFRDINAFSADTLLSGEREAMSLWKKFTAATPMDPKFFMPGFLRPNTKMPAFMNGVFQDWLLKKYGSIQAVNDAFATNLKRIEDIIPPRVRVDGPSLPQTPLVRDFFEFSTTLPADQKFGTAYSDYKKVPFPATAPAVGGEPWFFFVSRLLRTDFIEFTPEGTARLAASGLLKDEFIRTRAAATDLRVVSADILFDEWAAAQGFGHVEIPQMALDREAFLAQRGFWRWEFLTANYRHVYGEISGHGGAIRNTVIFVVLSIGGALLVNPLAAYALSRFRLRASYAILLFLLATIAFPAEVTMIPVFLQMKELNLLNTFGALILPGLANGFSIFLLKGFFDSLPRELYEAAEIDGASEWTMFWNISMTLSKPILAVIALEAFVSAYGTFFYALILAPDPKIWTIMVYIYEMRQGAATPVVYASLIITAIPTLLVFITCQNIILRGLVVPSEK